MLRCATNRGAFWTTRPFDLLHASSEDARLCPPHKAPLFSCSSIATIMTVRSLALLSVRRLPMLSRASQTGTGLLPFPPFLTLIVPLLGKENLVRLNGSNRLSPKPSVTGCPSWLCSTTPAKPSRVSALCLSALRSFATHHFKAAILLCPLAMFHWPRPQAYIKWLHKLASFSHASQTDAWISPPFSLEPFFLVWLNEWC